MRQFVAAGVSLILIGAIAGGHRHAPRRPNRSPSPAEPECDTDSSERLDRVLLRFGEGDIYLVKPGPAPHPAVGSDDDALATSVPRSPGRARIASGQSTGDEQSGWRIAACDHRVEPRASPAPPGRSRSTARVHRDAHLVAGRPLGGVGSRGGVPGRGGWRARSGRSTPRRRCPPTHRARGHDIEWAVDGAELYIADGTAPDLLIPSGDPRPGTPKARSPSRPHRTERSESSGALQNPPNSRSVSTCPDECRRRRPSSTHGGLHRSGNGPGMVARRESKSSCSAATAAPPRSTREIGILGENEEVVIVTVDDDDPFGPVERRP